jgi:hypothetical protein
VDETEQVRGIDQRGLHSGRSTLQNEMAPTN